MPSYRVVVEEITPAPADENKTVATEIFAQAFAEFDMPAFARALNPVTRKRKSKVKAE